MSCKSWTKAELATLADLYATTVAAVLAERIGRTERAVHKKAEKLGLKKRPRPAGSRLPDNAWTEADLTILRELYPDGSTREIGKRLGRNDQSVYNKAFQLGLKKSPAYMSTVHGEQAKKIGAAFRNLPPQLQEVVQLRGAINKLINQRSRK